MWHPASEPRPFAPLSDAIPAAVSRSFALGVWDALRRPGLYSEWKGPSPTIQQQLRPQINRVAKQNKIESEARGVFRLRAV